MNLKIVCEWIERTGGAEKVLETMVSAFPRATVHTLWNDAPERLPNTSVTESWLSNTPLRRHKAAAIPFMIPTWQRLSASEPPEKILASSYVFAHHARFKNYPDTPMYAYIHTPARFLWAPEVDPRGRGRIAKALSSGLRRVDRKQASAIHFTAANSKFVQKRIDCSWGIEASVIYPPVETDLISAISDWRDKISTHDEILFRSLPQEFIFGASRLVSYKRIDEVIRFALAVDLPVVIAGEGPELPVLKELASEIGVRAVFLGAVSTPLLYALYQASTAYVFPAVEDFGIMPVEAMAAGARVIVGTKGGSCESVQHGVSGIHTETFTGRDAIDAIDRSLLLEPDRIRADAGRFAVSRFVRELHEWIDGHPSGHRNEPEWRIE